MIREVGKSELRECLDVIHQSFATVADEFGLTAESCPTNGAFMPLERLESNVAEGSLLFAICEDEKIVAVMQLSPDGSEDIEIGKLAVLPAYRHKGYGRALIAFAKQKAKALEIPKIVIEIMEDNTRLKNWYEAMGFVHTGTGIFPHLPFTVGFMEYLI